MVCSGKPGTRAFGRVLVWAILLLSLSATACSTSSPSALDPRGPEATKTALLGWFMFGAAAFVCLLITVLAAIVGVRAMRRKDFAEPQHGHAPTQAYAMVLMGGVILPVIVLSALMVGTVGVMANGYMPPRPATVNLQVVGHQFWWEVRYPDLGITTANEIHIPAGQPVHVQVTTADVIHSFWVPQLRGKLDMIPGQPNNTWIQADQPGIYRGQCAEYCGLQHAHMAFLVFAEPPHQFDAWVQAQQQPAVAPSTDETRRGAQVFSAAGCITCHAIRYGQAGTGGRIGPDLTHVGSRTTIAAGLMDNSIGSMEGWIGNPQALKPGNAMPVLHMDSDSLRAVAAYLESLK